jgi:hypothetical protein
VSIKFVLQRFNEYLCENLETSQTNAGPADWKDIAYEAFEHESLQL